MASGDPLKQISHGHVADRERAAAALEARELQQIDDEPLEPPRLVLDNLHVSRARRLVERDARHGERFDIPADRGQGRIELV